MNNLAHFLALIGILFVLWLLFYEFIPRATKLVALYGLHDLRDHLYTIGERYTHLRETLMYRDAEFVLCVSISVVRDRDYRSAIGLAGSLARPQPSSAGWRRARYEVEIRECAARDPSEVALLRDFVDLALRSREFVFTRAIGGHPLPLLLTAFGIGVAIANRIVSAFGERTPLDSIGDAVSDIEARETPQGSALDLRRLIVS